MVQKEMINKKISQDNSFIQNNNLADFDFLDAKKNSEIKTVSTGSLHLDEALGTGGLPLGRIVELYGNESSGKTTVALHAVASFQKAGKVACYIDAEGALDLSYAKAIGIDLGKLLVAHPKHGENAFVLMESLIKTNKVALIVVDSVAALIPKQELEGNMDDQTIGLHARMMSKGLRRVQSLLPESDTCLLFINQLREKPGVMFGNGEVTTGGRALKFYASMRMEAKRSELLKDRFGNYVGIKSKLTVSKNKVARPFGVAFLEIMFNRGIVYEHEVIELALKHNVVVRSDNAYSFKSQNIAIGKEKLFSVLAEKPELFEQIKQLTIKQIHSPPPPAS